MSCSSQSALSFRRRRRRSRQIRSNHSLTHVTPDCVLRSEVEKNRVEKKISKRKRKSLLENEVTIRFYVRLLFLIGQETRNSCSRECPATIQRSTKSDMQFESLRQQFRESKKSEQEVQETSEKRLRC